MVETAKRMCLVCLGVVLTGALGELGLRLDTALSGPPERASEGVGLMRKTAVMGWVPRGGTVSERVDAHGTRHQVRVNSTGQRGDDVADLTPYHRRILFLGDSFTFATATVEEATFVSRTGELLSRTGLRVQVVNGGVDGYGTYQELAYYRYVGSFLEPDVVVLCFFGGNDFRDNMVMSRQGDLLSPALIENPHRYQGRHRDRLLRRDDGVLLLDPLSDDPVVRPDSPAALWLQQKSLLARLLGSRLNQLRVSWEADLERLGSDRGYHYYEIGLMRGRLDDTFQTAIELTLDCIEQLKLMVRQDGAELVVVLLPSQNQVDPVAWQATLSKLGMDESHLEQFDRAAPTDIVRDFCKASGIDCLDLFEDFRDSQNPGQLYLSDGHFDIDGHELTARRLADFLRDNRRMRSAGGRYRMARQLARRGDLRGAEEVVVADIALDPGSASLRTELASVYSKMMDWERARVAFDEALQLDPDHREASEGLGEALLALGDTSQAYEVYDRAFASHPGWWPFAERLTDIADAAGASRSAHDWHQLISRIAVMDDRTRREWLFEHLIMGQNHNANGDWALAERELRRAAWFATEDLFIGEIDYQLATTYLATSRLDRARQFLERVSANSPRYYEASISLGDMAEQSGQLSSAFHRYADAVLAQTDSTVAHKRFMATGGQLLVAGHATEVEDVCRNMLAARAESREIRLLLAVSLHLQERYSESVFESERLIEKYPDFEIARLHLAQSLEAGGRRAEAVTAYRYLLDLDNISDPVKEAARRRLSELAATPVAGRGSQTGISR